METYLFHHGILGQKWGVRRYQNEDGTLTPAGRRHIEKMDQKWLKKNGDKVNKIVSKTVQPYMENYAKSELNVTLRQLNRNNKISKKYANAYNRRLVEVMNKSVGDYRVPSGKVVRFVAKRGEIGAYTALADAGYDMSQLKSGVYANGRIAYRKTGVKTV